MRFLVLCCVLAVCASCSSRYYMKRGNIMYESGRYYKASTKFEKAFNKAKKADGQVMAAMRMGRCNEDINKLTDARNWYRKVVRADKENRDAYLKVAEINLRMGDYEGAAENYNKFTELFPDDERGKNGLYYLEVLKREVDIPGRYQLEIRKELNSRYSDFGPVYYPEDNNIVYFASTRKENEKKGVKKDPVTGDIYSHIYVTEFAQEIKTTDKLGNVRVKRFPEPRWMKPNLIRDSLLSLRSEGGMCFSADGSTLYFTSSRPIKGKDLGTRIYKVTKSESKDGKGKSGWAKVLPSGICGDTVSIGHPALAPDGMRMYFVTDRLHGGKGGKDIWFVDGQDGKWGEPQNAGDLINTEKDELYPYIRDNGELYFASSGHDGFGGLDLYKIKVVDGKEELEHLPAPLNSNGDDFGITFKAGKEEGMLTSSRSNRSDNLYEFSFIPQRLMVKVLARNNVTDRPIPKVNITVVSDDGTTSYLETDSSGIAVMEIEPQREYAFATENPRYLRGKGVVSTYRERGDRTYDLVIEMQPIEKPIVIPNIYFDVAKWNLREDAMENLKELLTILKDNPNITIELSAHTDMVGNAAANMVLSENRAKSVVDYLISKGVYWDRLQAKGYGKTSPRQINEKDAKVYDFLKVGDVLTENFVRRLKGAQKEAAMQLNRRIEFKVLNTNYKPGPNSLHNPNQTALSAEEVPQIGKTLLKDLKSVKGKFFTLQLGVFKNVPGVINQFKVVFTEKIKGGLVRYCTGIYDTREEAVAAADKLKKQGIESMIREYAD